MTDVFNAAKRSEIMRQIRSTNTQPELAVRRSLHASGFRYRLHVATLPGKPDIVLPKHRAVILVQGCFWHGHGCKGVRIPSSNKDYWIPKLARNMARDKGNIAALKSLGWRVFVIWECQTKGDNLPQVLTRELANSCNAKFEWYIKRLNILGHGLIDYFGN